METTVVAMTKTVRCASPVQMVTADTAPLRSRQKLTAAETAPKASLRPSPSRTANTPASDRTQFRVDHARKISPASGKNSRKAIPAPASAGAAELVEATPAEAARLEKPVETRCTRINAPIKPRIAARVTDARRKFNRSSDPSCEPFCGATAGSVIGTNSPAPTVDFRFSEK